MRSRILLSTLLLVFCMAGCGLEEAKETATPVSTEAPTEAPAEAPTEAPTETPTETPTEAPTEVPPQIPAETPPIKLEEGNQEEAVIEKDSLEDMDWNSVFELPAKDEIVGYMNPNKSLAPYIYGWLDILPEIKYSEYCIDFKADYLPTATYCCLGQWTLDYSALEKEYEEVRTEYAGVHGYGGFQNTVDGMVSILSFWDVYCKDESGREITIRAKRVYPETTDKSEDFGGEGTGAHCLVPYEWEAGHWYRMHVKCVEAQDTENTVIEQWVCDLKTDEWTLLCSYDLGVKDVSFIGVAAMFLEDYLYQYAGEVRSLEVRNIKYLEESSQEWKTVTSAYMGSNGGIPKYEGSYNFGTFGDRFWMITSGVGGDWYNNGRGKASGVCFLEEY